MPEAVAFGSERVEEKPPGPVQAYITFAVVEPPSNTMVGLLQSMMGAVAEILGRFESELTVAVAVAEQPLDAVTVNVYVPAEETVGFCSSETNPPGPDQS